MIRRRHVIYVEGYDPQGAEGYYRLFDRTCARFRKVWALALDLGELQLDSEDFAHWDFATAGPNWSVATRYEFLRQERFIRADMAQPLWRQVPRALAWIFRDLVDGTLWRIFRASWRFGAALAYFEVLLLGWLLLAALAGAAAGYFLPLAVIWRALAGAVVALLVFALLRPLADRYRVVQITNHWPRMRRFARGAPTWFDHSVEAGAQRLVAAAQANAADEIVLVGHSGGCSLVPVIMARALELDADLGRRGATVVLLTVGSNMATTALAASASRMREAVRRIAVEPSVRWVECQARKDVLNFWKFDPVAGIGVTLAQRHNPLIWIVNFKDMVSPALYRRFRRDFFRTHYQFIMAGDRRSPYEYLMLLGGPVAIFDWARRPAETFAAFAADGTFTAATPEPPAAA